MNEKLRQAIISLATEYNIIRAPTSSDENRRRIVILITDEYIKVGGGVHNAFFVERDLFNRLERNSKLLSFRCDRIAAEIREDGLPWEKRKGFNPLKLVSESYGYPVEETCLVKEVLDLLLELTGKEEKPAEEQKRDGEPTGEVLPRGHSGRTRPGRQTRPEQRRSPKAPTRKGHPAYSTR